MIIEEKMYKKKVDTPEELVCFAKMEKEEKESGLNLIKAFNAEAKRQNNKYRIVLHHGEYLHLSVWWCPFWFNNNAKQIYRNIYYEDPSLNSTLLDSFRNYEFTFIDGIEKKLYYKIKNIIDKIPQKWQIEIKEEKKTK